MLNRNIVITLFFVCFGITAEIFFVAFSNLINNEPFCGEPLWSLTGKTYVWMAPIYALIPFLAGTAYRFFKAKPLIIRILIYTLMIFIVEFIAGFLLEQITGKCPWEYTTGWHVMGYIRLDYAPAWMFFTYVVESLYLYLDDRL